MTPKMKKGWFISLMTAVSALPFLFNSCNGIGNSLDQASTAGGSVGTLTNLATGLSNVPSAASVPTGDAVVVRLQNGLQKNVSSIKGNFAKALVNIKANLPKVSDPTQATGYDQIELLAYAACSDLTTGNPSLMQSTYNVNPTATIATNQSALIAAGVKMLNTYTAGLASSGPTASQVTGVFQILLSQLTSDTTDKNTSTIAFMSVCIAANTAGTTLMSF